MKTLCKILFEIFLAPCIIFVVFCLATFANYAQAQDTNGINSTFSKSSSLLAPAADANFDQCEIAAGLTCNWINGNNQSGYIEGQSVVYRVKFSNLTAGSTGNTVTIEYDSIEGGLHALDYLTTYNRSITNADPCSGVAGCNLGVSDTETIPVDPVVTKGQDQTLGTSDDITQIPGDFTLFGGTITGVSAYTNSGSGTIKTAITITFSTTVTNPVLAWGGHIATRGDWGIGNTIVSGNGSAYHMRNGGAGGQQDLPLQISAVIFPARITIIKEVQTFNGGNASTQAFPFTATNFGTANFSLVDNNSQPADRIVNSNITSFGAANIVTVTESLVQNWSLADAPVCDESPGGLPQTDNSTTSLANRSVTLTVEEGEIITCTFRNVQSTPTAATASIGGRVLTETGLPLRRAAVTVFNANTLESRTVYTNSLGFYRVDGLTVNDFYIVTVAHGKRAFQSSTQSFTLEDNLTDLNFVAFY